MAIDFTTAHGQRALQELATEPVVWFTTVGDHGYPQPNLVWFLYDDGDVIIYTQPGTARRKHIAADPHVSLNFNSDPEGHRQTVLLGIAAEDTSLPKVKNNAAYVEKYAAGIAELGGTVESFSEGYSVPLRVTLTGLRGL